MPEDRLMANLPGRVVSLSVHADPHAKRERVAAVVGNVERFGRDEADYTVDDWPCTCEGGCVGLLA
jgi:hypothetical protein